MGSVNNRGTKDHPNYYCRYVDLDGKRKQVRNLAFLTARNSTPSTSRCESW